MFNNNDDNPVLSTEQQKIDVVESDDSINVDPQINAGDEEGKLNNKPAAPDWVKDVRKRNRELEKEIKELKNKTTEPPAQILKKPTIADFDFDAEKFEVALLKWSEEDTKQQAKLKSEKEELAEIERHYEEGLEAYQDSKLALGFDDFDASESTVRGSLSVTQQSMLISSLEYPAEVVYWLGKNESTLQSLVKEKNPTKFIYKLSQLESSIMKNASKNNQPAVFPEKTVTRGSGANILGGNNATLEKLRAEAEKTGDYTKVTAFKRSLKAK